MAAELLSYALLFVSAASYSSLSLSQRQTAGPWSIKNSDLEPQKTLEEREMVLLFLMEVTVDQITVFEYQGKTAQMQKALWTLNHSWCCLSSMPTRSFRRMCNFLSIYFLFYFPFKSKIYCGASQSLMCIPTTWGLGKMKILIKDAWTGI